MPKITKPATSLSEQDLVSIFEERAENLSKVELENWTCLSIAEQQVLDKLKGPGAKLLSGPRGSGKSTLLRRAYFELCKERRAFPVYVNYSRALALEPLFQTRANALELFRQWIFAKLLLGISDSAKDLNLKLASTFTDYIEKARTFVHQLEVGKTPEAPPFSIGPSQMLELLRSISTSAGVARSVLLLDDAAHAFSLRQQQEFFEVFRELRSRYVSAKAAIYPGITSFSPNFHVGHEAEVLEAWLDPAAPSYLGTMRDIARLRIPSSILDTLGTGKDEYIDLVSLASFGLPRGFLNMLSSILDEIQKGATGIRKIVLDAISVHAESVDAVFHNLALKLPRFSHYVEIGEEFHRSARNALRNFNAHKTVENKAVILALATPYANELEKVIKMLEYSGLVRKQGDLSKGVKGQYQRYSLHYASLISSTSLALGRSYRIADLSGSLQSRSAHALVKIKAETLLGKDYSKRCVLALPPCANCGTPRAAENQRFCMHCGAELANASVYTELLKAPIDRLPLPQAKIDAIKQHTNIRTVQDLITDDEQTLRKQGSYIGPIWSQRIKNVAEEFVSV
ncbi:hypothetical protein SAMN05216345_101881 [Cupriavidus sp. YR651]|uniref:hypothetical protein n=1 Tax=Cupriavidus sp. YR651 TaxID=1855315 RepID=UPI00088C67C5|nr:hypothetical protein [Cupriavidus sp. YR651]SDC19539.1 hypothetical protein SAMN05216345_101881 [Cupriavidus sp. YR651]